MVMEVEGPSLRSRTVGGAGGGVCVGRPQNVNLSAGHTHKDIHRMKAVMEEQGQQGPNKMPTTTENPWEKWPLSPGSSLSFLPGDARRWSAGSMDGVACWEARQRAQ